MTTLLTDSIKSYRFHFQGKRDYQEDNLYIDEKNRLFMVCDGIGGAEKGGVASKEIIRFLHAKRQKLALVSGEEEVKELVLAAYYELLHYVRDQGMTRDMGTTLVLLTLVEDSAYIAHVGDSKAFYFSQNKVVWASKDHSVVQELYDAGVLEDEKSMLDHPMKNRITNAIMANPDKKPPMVATVKLSGIGRGDFFILCTDGAVENATNTDVIDNFTNTQITLESRWNLFKMNAEHSSDNSSGIMVVV